MTVLITLIAIYFLGGVGTENFALALIIGVAAGAYSSIFIAAPLLVLFENLQHRRAK
jgi:preprotein translocase subunit SecF